MFVPGGMTVEHREVIAKELAAIMPRIARSVTSSFMHSVPLPPAQIFALLELEDRGRCHVSDVSEALRVTGPTATGILDRLVRIGYVLREHDLLDRRVINVSLTAAGQKAAKKIRRGIVARWKFILTKISRQDAQDYLRIVKDIQAQLSQDTKR